ncbi:hypothetical protein C8Q80DRAFT_1280846 [Daedaleopsis nitida]|nr:hypothetical protein C8Q80DRAFT_1280846 [Daedaleopsis nitida]
MELSHSGSIQIELLSDAQIAIQRLLSEDQPVLAPRDGRHLNDRYALDSYLHSFVDAKTGEVGHPNGRLVPSSDMLGGGVAAHAVEVETYFYATKTIVLLAEMFKAVFPEEYKQYRKAFDAGVWVESDPGLWLLWSRLEYGPRAVFLSLSGVIAHRVTEWKAVSGEEDEGIGCTPGRIGNIFFSPKNSLRRLAGRPPLWGKQTAYGKYAHTSSTS